MLTRRPGGAREAGSRRGGRQWRRGEQRWLGGREGREASSGREGEARCGGGASCARKGDESNDLLARRSGSEASS